MNAVKEDVIKLVEKELESANEKFPLFASDHEGYAVIKEEIEEAKEEQKDCCTYLDDLLGFTWEAVKCNAELADCKIFMKSLKDTAVKLSIEAIQIAAMAQKFIDSAESREDKG